ncbi:peptidoglycan-binding protein [Roseovarius sp. M141]|nr:peptidoglycan-binding protein [Roseovarius sp. M141]
MWGAGSAAAMRRYQTAEELPDTGAPDRATLKHMGLEF